MERTEHHLRIGIQHGAGYVGRELIRLIVGHPYLSLGSVSSEGSAGKPLSELHPQFLGLIDASFTASLVNAVDELDVIISCAPHGSGADSVAHLRSHGFDGLIVDMSADLRFASPSKFEERFKRPHPGPDLLAEAVYGLPEIHPVEHGTTLIANPGCFATGMALALNPVKSLEINGTFGITALTGASGSGAKSGPRTHFPDREGNVRAYSVMVHEHEDEVRECLDQSIDISFVPVSGPWTRGIWGSIQASMAREYTADEISGMFTAAYADKPFVRLRNNDLPQLHYAVGTPFCDLGWAVRGRSLVVGFALDNLLKGAASQAIQNVNLCFGMDERSGLIPTSLWKAANAPIAPTTSTTLASTIHF